MKKSGLGAAGEEFAAKYLTENGYKIACRNFSSRFGEIDIIAEKTEVSPADDLVEYLCFIEVKTRTDGQMTSGFEAVSYEKQKRVIKTAEFYITQNKRKIESRKLQPRFDCAEVRVSVDGTIYELEYIANAFC